MDLQEGDAKEVLELIGLRVRKARKARYSNYETFAKKFGLNKVTVLNIESGKDFNMSSLIKIAIALDIDFEELFHKLNLDILYYVLWDRTTE